MFKHAIAAALVLGTIACGTSTPTAPTPSPTTTATVVSLAITASAPSGPGFQLRASATLSDGTKSDVTSMAAWESSNPLVAKVSASGMVTVLVAGDVEFKATYQSTNSTLRLPVTQTRYTVSGRVSPVFPNQPVFLSNVTVQITSGPDAGAFALTDGSGVYNLSGLTPATVDLRVSLNGFTTFTLSGLIISSDVRVDPVLFPTPPLNIAGAKATGQCNDASWTWSQTEDRVCTLHFGLAWGVCPGPLCAPLGNIR